MKYLGNIIIFLVSCTSSTVDYQPNNGKGNFLPEIIIPEGFTKIDVYHPPSFLNVFMDCTNDVDSMTFFKSEEIDSTYLFITYFKPSRINYKKRSNESLKSNITSKLVNDLANTQDYLKVEVTDDYVYEEYYFIKETETEYRLRIYDKNRNLSVQLESLNKENNIADVINSRNKIVKINLKNGS